MRVLIIVALMVLSPLSFAEKTVDILGNSIFFDLPKKLSIKQNTDKQVVISNRKKTVTLSFIQTDKPADAKTNKELHPVLSKQYKSSLPASVKVKKDKTTNKFETRVSHLEFEGSSNAYLYQITYGVPVNGKLVLMNYTITQKSIKDKWLTIGRDMFDTLEINQTY